ncbi:MAG TPA: sensor histidine kinase [Polyangiaceae bacterium]|nr:sensor histidine kinase [Polyangiaceae bacterium]
MVQREALTLQAKLSLFLSVLLVLSIGVTGGVLIYQSAVNARERLTREHQLLAENRAFALRDNLEILESELERLALLPQVDFSDQNPAPELKLLADTHHHSVLYNTAVLLVSAEGDCIGSAPDRPEFKNCHFGEQPWFRTLEDRRPDASPDVLFRLAEDPSAGRTLNIAQPIWRRKRFVGALVGVIALEQANIVIPGLRDDLPPSTEALLVDKLGHVIFPTDRVAVAPDSEWATVVRAAQHAESGTLSGSAGGDDSLFAFATVQASSDFIVIFRRPWSVLSANLRQQGRFLAGVLLLGVVVASGAGLFLSAYLTRPLEVLRAGAARIAEGQQRPPGDERRVVRSDELGALVEDFLRMERAIEERDQELRGLANSLERRVAERTSELEAAQKALVEVERFAAMGKASAAIAHELKNALNGLGMAVELIVEKPSHPRVALLRTRVLSEINRLRDAVDSLSSFSRSPRIDKKMDDLTAVCHRAVELLSDLIADRAASVVIDMPPRLAFACDGQKIQGVMVNLVKNAVEAGQHVRVRGRIEGGEAILEVADDGPGLSDEARGHLFEPFFTTKPNGTGLGLATSCRYVEAHGGKLEATSATDLGGALLRVRLSP